EGQMVHVMGKVNGAEFDDHVNFSADNGFYYYLNNGANFLLFNIVKRWHLAGQHTKNAKLKADFLGKAGVGPLIPHVENSFFGYPNKPHFQVGGWNTGV